MAKKVCKVCNKTKDSVEDFYKSSGNVCCVCKNERTMERAKESRGLHMTILLEIRDNQREILERMDELRDFQEKLQSVEDEVEKVRKKLRKLSAK